MSDYDKRLEKAMNNPEFKKLWSTDEKEYPLNGMCVSALHEKPEKPIDPTLSLFENGVLDLELYEAIRWDEALTLRSLVIERGEAQFITTTTCKRNDATIDKSEDGTLTVTVKMGPGVTIRGEDVLWIDSAAEKEITALMNIYRSMPVEDYKTPFRIV